MPKGVYERKRKPGRPKTGLRGASQAAAKKTPRKTMKRRGPGRPRGS